MSKNETVESTEEKVDEALETKKIKLFKDRGEYKDDVFVCVNGRSFQIQRGEEVEVPNFIAEVLNTSIEQDKKTEELIDKVVAAFESKNSRL